MAISKYIMLLTPKKLRVPGRIRGFETSKKKNTFPHTELLSDECYCSRQKCNRSKNTLKFSWEKHEGLLIAVCQRPLQESISHKLLERRKKFQGKITPDLMFFILNNPLLEFPTSARHRCRIRWTSGNLFWFMFFIGNALIPTHDSFSFH